MKKVSLVMMLVVNLCLGLYSYGRCEQNATVRQPVLPMQKKGKNVVVQAPVLQPGIQITDPAEGAILDEGKTYKIKWTTVAISQGSEGAISFTYPSSPQGSNDPGAAMGAALRYAYAATHNNWTIVSKPALNGEVNFTVHKVDLPNSKPGNIYNFEIHVSFLNKWDGKSYDAIKKIKVRIK